MPNDEGSLSFQPPDPTRQQQSTAPSDPAVIRAALAHKPNTGTRPPVQPVRGSSGSNPNPITHNIGVDMAVDQSDH